MVTLDMSQICNFPTQVMEGTLHVVDLIRAVVAARQAKVMQERLVRALHLVQVCLWKTDGSCQPRQQNGPHPASFSDILSDSVSRVTGTGAQSIDPTFEL